MPEIAAVIRARIVAPRMRSGVLIITICRLMTGELYSLVLIRQIITLFVLRGSISKNTVLPNGVFYVYCLFSSFEVVAMAVGIDLAVLFDCFGERVSLGYASVDAIFCLKVATVLALRTFVRPILLVVHVFRHILFFSR